MARINGQRHCPCGDWFELVCKHHLVLDAFGGSGATLLAAEKTRRRARLIELDPAYVDVAIRRWQEMTGKDAVLSAAGETFAARAQADSVPVSDEKEMDHV
ncbi:DNA methyltransferase [Tateyamaria sp.]|uniref:DNA methyltransferase n=1 Tax=Tateyamaria sp. TaxID=1929288 RepID=UPI00328C322B